MGQDMRTDVEDLADDLLFTDDEENRAEKVCGKVEDEDDSAESEFSSPNASTNCLELNDSSSWPRSYRESMDMFKGMTPPSISFPNGINRSLIGISPLGNYGSNGDKSTMSLAKSLISKTPLDEEVPISTHPDSHKKTSIHRSVPPLNKSSFKQALVNGINVLTGIGLLTTPYAVKGGGWLSLTVLAIFAIIACYTGILLKRCLETSPALHSYPDIGQAAFGVSGRLIIAITLYAELYAACVEYVIIISDNMSTVFPNTGIHFAGIYLNAHHIFAIIGILVVLPTVLLRDLSLLSYLSVGGVGASILVVLCLLWVGSVDQVGFHGGGTSLNLAKLPLSAGIYSFCYAGHSVFPNIYSSMKEPSRFPIVLIASFLFCWFICTGAAISGFLIFGDSVESQFTLNMPIQLTASKTAICTVVIITISKYALTLTPVALSLEELVPSSYGVSVIIRTTLVISTLVVAMKVPFFASLMALAGSFLAVLIMMIFPCACYLSILGHKLSNLQKWVCICIGTLGFLIACDGTYSAVIRIAGQRG